MKRIAAILAVLLAASTLAFAGGSKEKSTSPRTSGSSGASTSSVTAPPSHTGQLGGTVSVIGPWRANELMVFQDMLKPFKEKTGTTVEYEGAPELAAVLSTRVQAGNPPDVAAMPGIGQVRRFAQKGVLVDLSKIMDRSRLNQEYAEGWIEVGTVNGKLVAVFMKASLKGLVWYDPQSLKAAGLAIPETWDQLMKESEQVVSKGATPWAIGLESGSASGWPGAVWIQEIFLKKYGPELYHEWWQGKLRWTSAEVKSAFQTFGAIAANPKMAYGGYQYESSANFDSAFTPVFRSSPKAYFHLQATTIQSSIQKAFPNLQAGTDLDFFDFPSINPQYAKSVQVGGEPVSEFNETPQANALISYLTTAQAQSYWVKGGDAISPNRDVPLTDYPNELRKKAADILNAASDVEFSADALMPSEMKSAFWSAVLNYVSNPGSLDSILAHLDQVQKKAYSSET